jgi:hypothetical protein
MSNMQIEIVANPINTVPTAKGSYQVIELAYKNKSFQDKLEGKKIMSFTNKEVFDTLSKAKFGDNFYVTRVKNDKGFWDWTGVSTSSVDSVQSTSGSNPVSTGISVKTGNVSPKSTYETPEERAARQILIVRQSSISSAVELAVANKLKSPMEVIQIAKEFEAYVFGVDAGQDVVEEKVGNFFEDMEDDLP